jgi:hypothetical protein
MTFKQILQARAKKNVTSTQESLQKSKKPISNVKLTVLSDCIQTTRLSKILEAELTSREWDLKGFWNNSSLEISKKLWLPQMTEFPDLPKNYYWY